MDEAGIRRRPLSLDGVPAFTPHWFREDARFREYLHDFKSFHQIFGQSAQDRRLGTRAAVVNDPIIGRVDGLLTSIGTRNKPVGEFYEQLKKHGQISADDLSRIVLGDLGGVLIPSPHCPLPDLDRVAALNEIFTGLQREHLEDIAVRSQRDVTPGVIVASMGDRAGARARTLLGVIRSGLVNELIIDRQLADSLLALLDEEDTGPLDAAPACAPAVRRGTRTGARPARHAAAANLEASPPRDR